MAETKKILLIDDDAFFVTILANSFVKHGFEVRSASDGKTGAEMARSEKPDLVLLDLTMTGMDGYATLAAIKGDEAAATIPVIILSSIGDAEDIAKAKAAGAADYLVKMKYTPEQLLQRIKEVLKA